MTSAFAVCRTLVLVPILFVGPSQNVFVHATESFASTTSAGNILERSSRIAESQDSLDSTAADIIDHNGGTGRTKGSQHGTHMTLAPMGKDCVIECENGGLCEFVADSLRDLRYIFQSGGLIQRCRCPPGWGGVACEIPTENCLMRTKTCELSGRPCDKVGNQWTCHCNIAEQVDGNLAAAVCRRGYTEYCSDYYDPEAPLYYCTNGGKCNSDFLSAQESPGDVATRRKYMDAGCRCNENFYGEHCEKLRFDLVHLDGFVDPKWVENTPYAFEKDGSFQKGDVNIDPSSSTSDESGSSDGGGGGLDLSNPIVVVVLGVVFLILMGAVGAMLFHFYRQYKREQRREARRAERRRARGSKEGDEFLDDDDDSSRAASRYTDHPDDITVGSASFRSGISSLNTHHSYSNDTKGSTRSSSNKSKNKDLHAVREEREEQEEAPEEIYLSDPNAYYHGEHEHFNDHDFEEDIDDDEDNGYMLEAVQPPSSGSVSPSRTLM